MTFSSVYAKLIFGTVMNTTYRDPLSLYEAFVECYCSGNREINLDRPPLPDAMHALTDADI